MKSTDGWAIRGGGTDARSLAMVAAAVAGGLALRHAIGRWSYSFKDRVVVITGGSQGLGLVIGRELAREGASLGILARDPAEVRQAVNDLAGNGTDALGLPCDVRNRAEVQDAMQQIIRQFGRIDVLINDAGVMRVGPLDRMTEDDFREAMDVHFWGPLYAMWAVVPHMRGRGNGRIVNISSIGGKIAVPHLAPYSASKFALVGLSDAVRAELRRSGIYVTTVCPGLMRTGSHVNALFKGRHREEYAWFALSAGMPLASINARRAARKIVEACRRGQGELVFPFAAKLATRLAGLFPNVTAGLMSLMNRMLPSASPLNQSEAVKGWDSASEWAPSRLTSLADRATRENNEQAARDRPG